MMLRNYLIVAIRNLTRNTLYSFINILGLAVGIASCILVLMFIQNELSYDQFHKNADRIYRVIRERSNGNQQTVMPTTSGALHQVFQNDFPEIEMAVRFTESTGDLQYGHKTSPERFALVSPTFFSLFDISFIKGTPESVIQQPMSVVLSERLAKKLFGDEDPMGKVITLHRKVYYSGDLVVRGIMKDISDRSILNHEALITDLQGQPAGIKFWNDWRPKRTTLIQNFILLKANADVKGLERKLQGVIEQYMGAEIAPNNRYLLQPLKRIYLYSRADYNMEMRFGGDIQEVYLIGMIGGFILLIACINFMSLTTARSSRRTQEVGLRKVVGAHRFQLMAQFFCETIVMVLVAMVIALFLVELTLPYFASFMSKPSLSLDTFNVNQLILGFIGLMLLVGFIAGSYPAFFLSAFQPIETLKGTTKTGGYWLRKGLVIVQFTLSISFMVGTVIVYQQMGYLQNSRLGQSEQILMTNIFWSEMRSNLDEDSRLVNRYQAIKQALLENPRVLGATASRRMVPNTQFGEISYMAAQGHGDESFRVTLDSVDEDFIPFYDLEIISGRNFSLDVPTDATHAVIINESAGKMLGWNDPVGKWVLWPDMKVIGVVKDFHYDALRYKIKPLIFKMDKSAFNILSLKLHPQSLDETLDFVKSTMPQFTSKPIDVQYWFNDEIFDQAYHREIRMGMMTTTFSVLAIFLSCLGLLGLATHSGEQRTKEIGIRKVLGASVNSVVILLSKDFVKLVLLSNLIAWPIAYAAIAYWLQDFAYRINITLGPFLLGATMAFIIALSTVSYQAWKTARTNPVNALRQE